MTIEKNDAIIENTANQISFVEANRNFLIDPNAQLEALHAQLDASHAWQARYDRG